MPPLLPKKGDCDTCNDDPPLVQRADDTEEVITNRLDIYKKETHPLVEFYESQGALVQCLCGCASVVRPLTRLCAGVLHTFEVVKGIADTPRLFKDLGIEE